MAMKQPHTRIISHESHHSIAPWVHSNGIPPHRHRRKVPRMSIKRPGIRSRALADLELVAVQMERVDGDVEVVDGELHD